GPPGRPEGGRGAPTRGRGVASPHQRAPRAEGFSSDRKHHTFIPSLPASSCVATLTFRTRVAASPEALRAWHARPGVLTLLTPPWERVEVEREAAPLEPGSQASLRIAVGPLRVRWVSTHEPTPEGFRDVQVKGPFRSWVHEHRFLPDGEGGAWLEDRLDYRLPGGALGSLLAGRAVRRRLARAFRHRHALTAHAVAMATQRQGLPRRIAITGSHGLVGSALASHLAAQGDRVVRLVRGEPQGPDERRWDPHGASLDPFALAGVDAIVHLAGESISRRWTKARRGEIMSSRAEGTRLLAQAAAAAGVRTFVCASAVAGTATPASARWTRATPAVAATSPTWSRRGRGPRGRRRTRASAS